MQQCAEERPGMPDGKSKEHSKQRSLRGALFLFGESGGFRVIGGL